ncbi:MAG: hypothetical protein OEY34_05810 [Cyclobacteriaceae bacterium]|nr:hypothetical protein [Cyclobacteriaceae bacterium]
MEVSIKNQDIIFRFDRGELKLVMDIDEMDYDKLVRVIHEMKELMKSDISGDMFKILSKLYKSLNDIRKTGIDEMKKCLKE